MGHGLSWLVSVAGKVVSENTPQPFSQSVITLTEDLFAVHMVFVPKLKLDLESFVTAWNNHSIRTERNRTPEQLWHLGLMATHVDQPEDIEAYFPSVRPHTVFTRFVKVQH